MFYGKFWSCNDTSVPDQAACVGTFVDDGVVSAEAGGDVAVAVATVGSARA